MADFSTAIVYLIANEGTKFTNDPDDPGGATKFGVTLAALSDYRSRKLAPARVITTVADVQNLTLSDATQFYKDDYWPKVAGDQLTNEAVACCVFDAAVNRGAATIVKLVQLTLTGNGVAGITPDGVIGPKTVDALNRQSDIPGFMNAFVAQQLNWYTRRVLAKPNQKKFFRTWSRRATAYLETVI